MPLHRALSALCALGGLALCPIAADAQGEAPTGAAAPAAQPEALRTLASALPAEPKPPTLLLDLTTLPLTDAIPLIRAAFESPKPQSR